MSLDTISKRLVALLKKKEFLIAQQELFAPSVISLEPDFHPNPQTAGLTSVLQKEKEFLGAIMHWEAFDVSDPVLSKFHFCIRMYSKIVMQNDQRVEVDELIMYEVQNGKIVKEQFFYLA
ncbi:MAG TPA: hypothetical protein DCE41_10730 [Cytophagales bacterium]|nr:hypothetical protein [Cytophagales bacterium]HAA24446.1 hypothetical protein [Cytophagales bacterium]HAP61226.1 hypothetical protein [Cytophagales bacterium]